MNRQKGFTLIEAMVVLSILSIIAILSYNFFGSVMKETNLSVCAQKIHRDLRVLSGAMSEYYRKNGGDASTGIIDETASPFIADVFSSELKSGVTAPNECRLETEPFGAMHYRITYSTDMYLGTAAGDPHVNIDRVSAGVCKKYNELFTPDLGTTIPTLTASVPCSSSMSHCHYHSGNGYYYIKYINEVR